MIPRRALCSWVFAWRLIGVGIVGLIVSVPGPAAAATASAQEFRSLVEAAVDGDRDALERLRDVDSVDGRPVDMHVLLNDAGADETADRLRTLAATVRTGDGGAAGNDVPAEEARAGARRILAGSDYRPEEPPRPFRAPLRWLGERLEPLGRPFAAVWDWVAQGPEVFLPVAILTAAIAVVASLRLVNRRSPLGQGAGSVRRHRGGGDDPDALERDAVVAEETGDYASAVRLRFRAGLLRLDHLGALTYRPSLTTGAVTATVPSPVLARLATDFEAIAYGDRPASADDAAAARERWRAVLAEHDR